MCSKSKTRDSPDISEETKLLYNQKNGGGVFVLQEQNRGLSRLCFSEIKEREISRRKDTFIQENKQKNRNTSIVDFG